MQLKYPVYKSLLLSAVVALAVSLSQLHQNGKIVMWEEVRDWHVMEAKTECVNTATTPWSPRREQWVWGRGPSKAKKAHSNLEKWPYPCVRCSSKPHSHPQTLSTYALPSFSLFTLNGRLSQKHMPRLLTVVMHMLVQRSLRCVRLTLQISKPSFMSLPVTMLLLDFCHLIQHCTSDYIHRRNMEVVGGMQATEEISPTFICTLALVSCSYPTLSQR